MLPGDAAVACHDLSHGLFQSGGGEGGQCVRDGHVEAGEWGEPIDLVAQVCEYLLCNLLLSGGDQVSDGACQSPDVPIIKPCVSEVGVSDQAPQGVEARCGLC